MTAMAFRRGTQMFMLTFTLQGSRLQSNRVRTESSPREMGCIQHLHFSDRFPNADAPMQKGFLSMTTGMPSPSSDLTLL